MATWCSPAPFWRDRDFNRAVDDYGGLLGLSPGLIENVTDGTDAHLVAIDADGRLLGSEEDIVDAKRRNRIDDIYLLRDRPRTPISRCCGVRRGRHWSGS